MFDEPFFQNRGLLFRKILFFSVSLVDRLFLLALPQGPAPVGALLVLRVIFHAEPIILGGLLVIWGAFQQVALILVIVLDVLVCVSWIFSDNTLTPSPLAEELIGGILIQCLYG